MGAMWLMRILNRFIPNAAATSRRALDGRDGPSWGETAGLTGPELPDADDPLINVPRYPPFDTGIPLVAVDKVVRSQQELIDRIFRTAGLSRAEFERRVEPVIANLANFVHLLPATATHHHRGAGGLFRFALEIGLNSLQAANGAVFPISGGVERRYSMQPRWSLATMIAGMCSQVFRAITSMAVVTRDNEQWLPLMQALYPWGQQRKADVYFIRWLNGTATVVGAQASSALVVGRIVPDDVLQYLALDNGEVMPAMMAAITGADLNASENPISRLVAPITSRVIEDDMRRSSMNYGHHLVGFHLEPHLIDAMRRLVRLGKWSINNPNAIVWLAKDGTYLVWDQAFTGILNLLSKDAFVGVPKDPDTLADLLISAGVLRAAPEGGAYWTIYKPDTFEALESVVRLAEADLIFPSGFDISAVALESLLLGGTPPARPSAPQNTPERRPAPAMQEPLPLPVSTASLQPPETGRDSRIEPYVTEERSSQAVPTAEPKPVVEIEEPVRRNPARDEKATSAEGKARANSEKLLASLPEPIQVALRQMVSKAGAGQMRNKVVWLQTGLGIAQEEVSGLGCDFAAFVEELFGRKWLWVNKEKPTRKVHSVEVEGGQARMIVLRRDVATALGFSEDV
jgi:conjugal transfer pilus assembly protein TraI